MKSTCPICNAELYLQASCPEGHYAIGTNALGKIGERVGAIYYHYYPGDETAERLVKAAVEIEQRGNRKHV